MRYKLDSSGLVTVALPVVRLYLIAVLRGNKVFLIVVIVVIYQLIVLFCDRVETKEQNLFSAG